MSKPDRDLALVLDVVLACRDVESFLGGVERADFLDEEAGGGAVRVEPFVIVRSALSPGT